MQNQIALGLLKYLAFFIAIIVQKATMAICAKWRGDRSITTETRATFNPFPHIDLLGSIILPLLTIVLNSFIVLGWAKNLDIDTRYFKNRKKETNLVQGLTLSSNFIIAILCAIILRILGNDGVTISATNKDFLSITQIMIFIIGQINLILGCLNALPWPGSSGWFLLLNNVSYQMESKIIQNSMLFFIITLGLLISGILNFYFKFFLFLYQAGANTIAIL